MPCNNSEIVIHMLYMKDRRSLRVIKSSKVYVHVSLASHLLSDVAILIECV